MFECFDERGGHVSTTALTIPGVTSITVYGFARSMDGRLAAGGISYGDGGNAAPFLAQIAANAGSPLVTRSAPYRPDLMAFAADGTLWTAGPELDGDREPSTRYNVLRHFDRAGKLIGSFVPRSSFASRTRVEYGYMAACRERVGWYSGPIFGPGGRYFEISPDGGINHFAGLPLRDSREWVDGLALIDGGATFASSYYDPEKAWSLYLLDRDSNAWRPVILPGVSGKASWAKLYGGHGQRLVVAPGSQSVIRFFDVSK